MEGKKKILFVIPTLTAGGAERIMTFLSKNLNDAHFETKLIVTGSAKDVAYNTSEMNIQFLGKSRVLFSVPGLIRCFIKEKPQIIMGSISHMNFTLGLISLFFPKIVFVGRQSGITKAAASFNEKKKNSIFNFLMRFGLRQLDYIICQSADMLQDCVNQFQISEQKLKIIHNPITENFSGEIPPRTGEKDQSLTRFVTIGRLYKIKGHERLLKILSDFNKPYTYTIVGDGPEKEALINVVKELGIESKVRFIGFTKDVTKHLLESDYFLQGSYSEGFPNALLESCAVGTPVIAFDVPGGTSEIVEEGINGYLVDNNEAYLNRLNHLEYLDPQKVSESVYKRFAKDIILKEYAQFFQKLVDKR